MIAFNCLLLICLMIVMWLDRSLNTSAATLGAAADVRIVYKGSAFLCNGTLLATEI